MDATLAVQAEHGLEPLTAAGPELVPGADPVVGWLAAARRTDGLVKAVVRGPVGASLDPASVRATIAMLADAGCPWIEVHEWVPDLRLTEPDAPARFAAAHVAATDGLDGVHLSLALLGGKADALGSAAVFAGGYASLAVDLIAGPDNWRLVAAAPTDRGIVAGAMSGRVPADDGPEVLIWAARYAASTAGRGVDRVGLATAGSLADLTWDAALRKLERLGSAARLVTASPDERRAVLDPRAIDIRSAALGRATPPRRRDPAP
ncbi:hypothetical protein BH20CHL7_BH20CHL7_13470 [soil metagenome]